jgi:spermidine/putrescine transport system ATP-binding protein
MPRGDLQVLEIDQVSKSFEGSKVLDSVSLSVTQGDFFSLLGPSGCGKTTLLRIIAGFESPDTGAIRFDGKDITDISPRHRPFNIVFQKYALFPHLNVFENVAFGPLVKGHLPSKIKSDVMDALRATQMDEFAHRRVDTLSGGQQQRVALARAIVNRPQVLLLDEPLSALDQKLREIMRVEMISLQRKLGITFILVTHDQEEALTMSDKVVVLRGGHIEQFGRPEDIYRRPESAFVADFVGAINVIEVEGVKTYVRPEEFQISKDQFAVNEKYTAGRVATVKEILFKGAVTDVVVEAPWAYNPSTQKNLLIVQMPSSVDHGLDVAKSVYVRWASDRCAFNLPAGRS